MNYFAHGRLLLDSPYALAGAATPDWLNVVDRRARARRRLAEPWLDHSDARVAELARGIVRHHHDDQWFHAGEAFSRLSFRFAVDIRDRLGPDDSLRPSFLGHILVELLLDAVLIEADPQRLDDYYRAVDALDRPFVAQAVSRMTTRPAPRLEEWIGRFSQERFLYDYLDDAKLLTRLNQVMRRVGLPRLSDDLLAWLPAARGAVGEHAEALLWGEVESPGERGA